jgi:hypothetical protein
MIPSRPLSFAETIRETFFLYARTFSRYLLLFIAFCIPGLLIVTYATTNFIEQVVISAQHDIDFNDQGLTAIRNEARNWLSVHDPLLIEEEQLLQQSDTTRVAPADTTRATPADTTHTSATDTTHTSATDTTRTSRTDTTRAATAASTGDTSRVHQFVYYFRTNLTKFSSSIALFVFGCILLLLGIFSLAVTLIDLACQVFEEHGRNLRDALRATVPKQVWNVALLFIIYVAAISAADGLVTLIDSFSDAIAGFISSLLTIAQVYLMVRLSLTLPALVSEGIGPFTALRRSWHLTRRSGWRIFKYTGIFSAIIMIVIIILSMVSGLVVSGTLIPWYEAFLSRPEISVAWFLASVPGFIHAAVIYFGILFIPVFALLPIFATVFYYDLRTRHEGPLVYLEE